MANTIGELLVKLGVDVTGLTEGLSGAIGALDSTGKAATRTGNVIAKAFENLGIGDASAKVAAQMKQLQNSFQLIEKAYAEGKVTAADYARAQEGVRVEIEKLANSTRPAAASIQQLGSAMASAGAILSTALTVPLAAIGAESLKAGLDFETAMKIIRAGTGATGTALAGMQESFSKVFGSLPVSARDAATAITEVFQRMTDDKGAKLAGSQLEDLSSQLLNLARITHSELTPLGETVTRAFADWSIATKDAAGAMDFLFKVSQSTGINITKLTENVVKFGAPMRALGYDFEQSAALMGKWEKEGVNMETVLAALRFAIANFGKAGLDGKQALEATINAIKEGKTSAEQMSVGLSTVGKRGMTDFTRAVVEGRFDIDEFVKSLKGSKETINDVAGSTVKFTEKITLLKNQSEVALKPIGDALLKSFEGPSTSNFMKGVIDGVHSLAESFAAMEPSTQAMVVGLAGVAAAAGPVLASVGLLAMGLTALEPLMVALGGTATVVAGGIAALGVAFTAIQISGVVSEVSQLIDVLKLMGKGEDDAKASTGILASAFEAVKSGLGEFASVAASLPWTQIINPWAALKAAVHEFTLEIAHSVGIYPELSEALKRTTTATADLMRSQSDLAQGSLRAASGVKAIKDTAAEAAIAFKLARGNFEQIRGEMSTGAANSNDYAVALARLRTAAAAAHVDIGKLTGDEDAANKAAERNAQANDDMFKRYEAYGQSVVKLSEELQKLHDEEGKVDLKLGLNFGSVVEDVGGALDAVGNTIAEFGQKASRLGGKAMADYKQKTLEVVEITTSTFSQMSEAIQRRIGETYKAIGTMAEAFKSLGGSEIDASNQIGGIESELRKVEELYRTHFKLLNGQQAVSDNDMQRLRIKAAEDEIAIAEKTGLAVSDARIAALNRDKAAYQAAHLDIAQAYAVLGMKSTAEVENQAKLVAAAYQKVRDSAISSQADIEKATLGQLGATLEAQVAHGVAVNESQKRAFDDLLKTTKEGHRTLAGQWDLFSNQVGDSIGLMLHGIGDLILTGKGSLREIFSTAFKSIMASMVNDFIKPAEAEIGKFLTKSIVALLGDQGIAGVKKAFGELGDTIKGVLGLAKSATSAVSGVAGVSSEITSSVFNNAIDSSGNIIKTGAGTAATGAAGSASGAAGGLSGGSGGSPITGIAQLLVSAGAGITQGLQMAHLIATAGKIEVNTREASVVLWQNGKESIQGLLKSTSQGVTFLSDRMSEVRDALFDPVTARLEEIIEILKKGITVGKGDDTGTATTKPVNTYVEPGKGPSYGIVGSLTGGQTSKAALADLVRQLAEVNADLERIKADRKAYADELNNLKTPEARRIELSGIDATNSGKQTADESLVKALESSISGLTNAIGRGTAETVQTLDSLNTTIQSSFAQDGSAAQKTATALEAISQALPAFSEGNQGTGAYQADLAGTPIYGGIGSIAQSVTDTWRGLTEGATQALGSLTDALKSASGSIASVAAGFTDGASVLGSDLIPRITSGPVTSPSFGTPSGGGVLHNYIYIDGVQVANSLVGRLEMQGVRI